VCVCVCVCVYKQPKDNIGRSAIMRDRIYSHRENISQNYLNKRSWSK